MKLSQFKALRSALGLRLAGTIAAATLLPILAIGALLYARGTLSAGIATGLGVAALTALAAAAAIGASLGDTILQRIEELVTATGNISREKFPATIPIGKNDDFAPLLRGFNDMAREVAMKLAVQAILAQLDDAMLNKRDIPLLIHSVLRCIDYVTRAEVFVLGLFESDTSETVQLHIMHRGSRTRIDTLRIDMGADIKRHIPLSPTFRSTADAPFPAGLRERLREKHGVDHFFALPVCRGNRSWGVMVSCHKSPVDLSTAQVRLLSSVSNRLITGLRGAERDVKIHNLAFVDTLTGLPNRVALHSLLTQRLAVAQSNKSMLAVLFIDLDRFKLVNDTFGHAIGDRVLVEAARRIQSETIEDDIVARVAGDAFTVVLSFVKSRRDSALVARKLIKLLSRAFEFEGQSVYTGASVGIAISPHDAERESELVKMAEAAMYRAKSTGRNRLAFYEKLLNADSKRRTRLDVELRNALTRNELVLHYQPQIDLATGKLCGVEALVRWQHPTRGLLFPGDFIEDAEEIGLIPEIGTWVMKEACLQHTRWRKAGVPVPRVSVNVSNGQLPRSNFVSTVREIIATTRLAPGALEIEVTESMLVEGGKPAMEALNLLAADGMLIAIDDFGTGYSSFSYLKTMPAQVLKLDMSFIVDLRPDNDAGKIVAAIINMAHALQKEVVAEGIERTDQLLLLKSLGCDRGQGYLLSKPVEAQQISQIYGGAGIDVEATAPRQPVRAPAPAPAPSRPRPEAVRSKAPEPAAKDDPDGWEYQELDEQLTVPRFFDDEFLSKGNS